MRGFLILLATLFCGDVHGQIGQQGVSQSLAPRAASEIAWKLAPGSWTGLAVVTMVVAADGTVTVTIDASKPVTVTGAAGSTPPPPPPPVTTPLEKHKALVRAATVAVVDANKVNTSAALAKLYTTIAGLPVTERGQLVQSTDILFTALGLPQVWSDWKAKVDISLAQFTTLADAKAAWLATGVALEGGAN